jgi:hypothetical protein
MICHSHIRRLSLATLAALALAGCGRSEPPPQRDIIVRSAQQQQLFTMSEELRRIGLKRAMQGAGMPCAVLTKTAYAGRYKNMDQWVATCTPRDDRTQPRDWALFVGADDSVQVRLCADVEKVGLPSCATARPPSADDLKTPPPAAG